MHSDKCFPTYSKDMRTFHTRREISKMSLGNVGKIEAIFRDISKEVFGRKVTVYFRVYKFRCTCSFTVVLTGEQYDPQFLSIIVDNLVDAVMQTYKGVEVSGLINECKRKARLYYALYMERQIDKINKIKEEYAEVFKMGYSLSGNT